MREIAVPERYIQTLRMLAPIWFLAGFLMGFGGRGMFHRLFPAWVSFVVEGIAVFLAVILAHRLAFRLQRDPVYKDDADATRSEG